LDPVIGYEGALTRRARYGFKRERQGIEATWDFKVE